MTTLQISGAVDVSSTGKPSLGMNLNATTYYGEPIFLDLCKHAPIRAFCSNPPGSGYRDGENWVTPTMEDRDELGNITSLPAGCTYFGFPLMGGAGPTTGYRGGRFKLTWDGASGSGNEVRLNGTGGKTVTQRANEIIFDRDGTNTTRLEFYFNPSHPAKWPTWDTPRNFKCFRIQDDQGNPVDDEARWNAGNWFRQEYLDLIAGRDLYRFMEWTGLNGRYHDAGDWSRRPGIESACWMLNLHGGYDRLTSYGTPPAGVPWEVQIDLCNLMDVRPWFTFPHKANDDYIRQAAILVRDRLDPALIPIFEFSNEAWNFGTYSHPSWYKDMAHATIPGFPGSGEDYNGGFRAWYAKRSTEMSLIVREVFGARPVRTTLAWARELASQSNDICEGLMWRQYESGDTYRAGDTFDPARNTGEWTDSGSGEDVLPYSQHDGVAVACYYADRLPRERYEDIHDRLYADGEAATATWMASVAATYIPAEVAKVANWKALTASYVGANGHSFGLNIYEGNQHLVLNSVGQAWLDGQDAGLHGKQMYNGNYPKPEFQSLFEAFTYHVDTGANLGTYLDALKDLGVENYAMYHDVRPASRYGMFGFRRHWADENPVQAAFDAWSQDNPRWWLR